MYVVAFQGQSIKRLWVRKEETVIYLLKEGCTVYREATSQVAQLQGDQSYLWKDVKEEKDAERV